ncbi:hypothetical protein COM06_20025 [Bacillus toyonensis]|uniref:hypothetical protein n=1 Tax=Bacillus toyonensis TaxID=155322 RepID=UPI000BF631D1|nr:hypothetical protein [Bacillus toyonensis]PGB24788.1 hypothetical protein COM06_20025 [Bacillus toyonensis]
MIKRTNNPGELNAIGEITEKVEAKGWRVYKSGIYTNIDKNVYHIENDEIKISLNMDTKYFAFIYKDHAYRTKDEIENFAEQVWYKEIEEILYKKK